MLLGAFCFPLRIGPIFTGLRRLGKLRGSHRFVSLAIIAGKKTEEYQTPQGTHGLHQSIIVNIGNYHVVRVVPKPIIKTGAIIT